MTPKRTRDDGGRYVETRDRADVLEAMEPMEPYTTGELVDILGWPRRSLFQALDDLADDGKVRKKKPSETNVIWMFTDESEQ